MHAVHEAWYDLDFPAGHEDMLRGRDAGAHQGPEVHRNFVLREREARDLDCELPAVDRSLQAAPCILRHHLPAMR